MLQSLLPRIMGYLVIIITLALGPSIYDANSLIATMANGTAQNTTNLIGLTVVQGFGAFIIIFGLLISGGMMAVAGSRTGASANRTDFMKVIGSVIVIIVMLTIFPTVSTYLNTLINTAIAAGDSLGQVGFGIVAVIIYVGILTAAAWGQVIGHRALRRKSSRRSSYGSMP